MFSNFVTFTEVVKLSPIIHYNLEGLNFHKDIIDLIFAKGDLISASSTFKLVPKEHLDKLLKFILLINFRDRVTSKRWIGLITRTITDDNSDLDKILFIYEQGCKAYDGARETFFFGLYFNMQLRMKRELFEILEKKHPYLEYAPSSDFFKGWKAN